MKVITLLLMTLSLSISAQKSSTITFLNKGSESLIKRLEIIQSARESIEVESFIFNNDLAGKILINALVDKASNENISVRILIDAAKPIFKLKQNYAAVLKTKNVQIRYYNDVPIYKVKRANQRNHRKLIVVDKKLAITGGRNIADEYFDLGGEYNFLDRDILVEGEIVVDMHDSFNEYWNSKYVSVPKHFSVKNLSTEVNFLTLTEAETDKLKKIKKVASIHLEKNEPYTCSETYFISDAPGKEGDKNFMMKYYLNILMNAESKIEIESPYFIVDLHTSAILKSLLEKKVKVQVNTNSLYSTDAFYTAAVFNLSAPIWANRGVDLRIYDGSLPKSYPPSVLSDGSRWGIHSKSVIIDDKDFIIGSYNFDPRSKDINNELAIYCKNSVEAVNALKRDAKERSENYLSLDENGLPTDGRSLLFNVSDEVRSQYKLMKLPSFLLKGQL